MPVTQNMRHYQNKKPPLKLFRTLITFPWQLILIFLLFSSTTLVAASNAPTSATNAADTMLYINADYSQINYHTGITIYTGHVQAKRGDMTLISDKLTIYRPNNQLQKIIAIGNPAHFHQNNTAQQKPPVDATASTITYLPAQHLIVLQGNAKITQGASNISSPVITYDTQQKIMHSMPTAGQRTHIVIDNAK